MKRRHAICALSGLVAGRILKAVSPERIVVVYDGRVAAYGEALEGIRAALGRLPALVRLEDAGAAQPASLAGASLAIAVGVEALRALANLKTAVPFISTMVLHSETAEGGPAPAAEILLDTPLPQLLDRLHAAFPKMTRLGLLRNPAAAMADGSVLAMQAKQHGFTPHVVDCRGPAELLPAFLSLKRKADMVLCFPDASLYNSITIKPLIMASLDSHLPIVGFSSNFVRAGAALGVYPDFVDIGRQAAELALRYTPGTQGPLREHPRKLVVGVNQRVLRLIGLERPEDASVVVYR